MRDTSRALSVTMMLAAIGFCGGTTACAHGGGPVKAGGTGSTAASGSAAGTSNTEALDRARVATLTTGTVTAFEVPLPTAFTPKNALCTDATVRVRADGRETVLRGDVLKKAVGPQLRLSSTGPLLENVRIDGLVFFGWLEGKPSTDIEVSGTCGDEVSFASRVTADTEPSPVIGLPFAKGRWKANNGPSMQSAHRRAVIRLDGATQPIVMERFGIDWMRAEDDAVRDAKEKDNTKFRSYGEPLLAVADGEIIATHDGIPENTGGPDDTAVPVTEDTIGGNFVALRLEGRREVAFYAHLQPGSLRVQKGSKVRRGDVLGLLGNSGNSTAPHLHFHLARFEGDGPFRPLRSTSVAYRLRDLGVVAGACTRATDFLPSEDQIVDASACATTP